MCIYRCACFWFGVKQLCSLMSSVILLSCLSTAFSQEKNPQRGFQIGNAYKLSDIESINTTSGNLMLNLPLGKLAPGRGELNGSFGLRYNSKIYDSTVAELQDETGQVSSQNIIVPTEQAGLYGGWHYTSPLDYSLVVINRNNVEGGPFQCTANGGASNYLAIYLWKVKIIYPDGAEREFRPTGYNDLNGDGYFNVEPTSGGINGCNGISGSAPNPLTYFSTDGSYTRLTINRGVGWTLSLPDGTRLVSNDTGQYLYDRNNNYLTHGSVTLPNGHVASAIVDQFGRYVAMESNAAAREDYIYSLGYNGQSLMWTVKWKTIFVLKPYKTTGASGGRGRGNISNQIWEWDVDVIDRITLPAALGGLFYQFHYSAPDFVRGDPEPTTNSLGWGEVNGITLPSGAGVSYPRRRRHHYQLQ